MEAKQVIVEIVAVHPDAKIPYKTTDGAAAFDLVSVAEKKLAPGEKFLIPTGIKMAIQSGYFGMIRPRSGLAAKHGIDMISSGVIDSDYRGEVFVSLINHSPLAYQISVGDRIAQLLILPVPKVEFVAVDVLSETNRGEGGHGSTGQ